MYSMWEYWPCINVTIETWTEEEIRRATTATCPDCGVTVRLTALLVDGGTFRILGTPSEPDAGEP